jgi:hypothetical protein
MLKRTESTEENDNVKTECIQEDVDIQYAVEKKRPMNRQIEREKKSFSFFFL